MKPGTPTPALRSTRLLDQLRERIRYLHYSPQTEKAYLYWVRFSFAGMAVQGDRLGSDFNSLPRPHHKGRAQQRPVRYPRPSACAEERNARRIKGARCLSAASFARPRRA